MAAWTRPGRAWLSWPADPACALEFRAFGYDGCSKESRMSKIFRCTVEVSSGGTVLGSGRVHAAGIDEEQARAVAAQAMYDHGLWGDEVPDRAYAVTGMEAVDRRQVPSSEVVYEADILPAPPRP